MSATKDHRNKLEMQVFGGLIFGLSLCVAFNPIANIATLVGPDGTTASSGVPLQSLIGSILQVCIGLVGITVGYLTLVHDYNKRYLTAFLILITQFAWWPFITDMSGIGKGARSDPSENPFIPVAYNPSVTDVRFVGAMGILAVMAYGPGILGSLGFMEFSLFAFQSGKPQDRPASYYRSRLTFYGFIPFLAGLTQLMLGSYIISNFGNGPLENGAIGVAVYIVHFPEITVFVGLVQMLVGMFALARRFGYAISGPNDNKLQIATLFMWICTFSLQIVTQISYAEGGAFAAAAPSIACLAVGLHVMPAFLDYKMRTTPDDVTVAGNAAHEDEGSVDVMHEEEKDAVDEVLEKDLEDVDV